MLNCALGEVKVHGSLFYYCDEQTAYIIADLFQYGSKKIRVLKSRKIVVTVGSVPSLLQTVIAHEINLNKPKLKQGDIRAHLVRCLNEENVFSVPITIAAGGSLVVNIFALQLGVRVSFRKGGGC